MTSATPTSLRQVRICIGKAGPPVGSLVYVKQGRRENSAIDEAWLANAELPSIVIPARPG